MSACGRLQPFAWMYTQRLVLTQSGQSGIEGRLTINDTNDPILEWVEKRGGGYVWEPEVFAVTLLDVSIDDDDAERLSHLVGVQQIAVDATKITLEGLKKLAGISGIRSLVLRDGDLKPDHLAQLRTVCPEVLIVE